MVPVIALMATGGRDLLLVHASIRVVSQRRRRQDRRQQQHDRPRQYGAHTRVRYAGVQADRRARDAGAENVADTPHARSGRYQGLGGRPHPHDVAQARVVRKSRSIARPNPRMAKGCHAAESSAALLPAPAHVSPRKSGNAPRTGARAADAPVIPGQEQQAMQERARVSCREHESIAVGPTTDSRDCAAGGASTGRRPLWPRPSAGRDDRSSRVAPYQPTASEGR